MQGIQIITALYLSFWVIHARTHAQDLAPLPALVPSYSKNLFDDNREFGVDCIQNVFHDSRGRLWLQTCGQAMNNGLPLVRYDGYRFYPVRLAHEKNIDDHHLTALGINSFDQLYGTYINHGSGEFGAFLMDLDTEEVVLHEFGNHSGMTEEVNPINMISIRDTSYLMLTLDKGVLLVEQLNGSGFEEFVNVNDPEILPRLRGWTNSLLKNLPSEIWFMGVTLPLIRYDKQTRQIRKYQLADFSEKPDPAYLENIRTSTSPASMAVSKAGKRYLYHGHKFYYLDKQQDGFRDMDEAFPQNWIAVGLFQDTKENICFVFRDTSGSYHAILQDSDGNRHNYSAFFENFPKGNLTNVVSHDFREEIYVCGLGKLMHMAVREPGAIQQVLPGIFISSVMEMPDNRFLVNTVYEGWFEVRGDLQQTQVFNESLNCNPSPFSKLESMVQQIGTDENGHNWWLKSKHLFRYNSQSGTCQSYDVSRPGRFNPALFALVGKDKVALTNWNNELFFFDLVRGEEFIPGGSIPRTLPGTIQEMHVSPMNGILWILSNGSLWKINLEQETGTRIGSEAGFDDLHFLSVYEDNKGNLWLGTVFGGLVRYDPEEGMVQQVITYEQGLAHNSVFSIIADEEGDMWVSTLEGITVLSREGDILASIYEKDGLNNNQFPRFDAFRASDGRLFIGNETGLNVIDPLAVKTLLKRDKVKRKIYFTELVYYDSDQGKEITQHTRLDQLREIDLPADRRNLQVQFAISSYLETHKNYYAYRLEGIENDWHYLGAQHELNLINLPAGSYRLQIKGSDFRNNWTEEVIEIPIHAREFFYKQPWFYLLCALPFLIFGLAWAYRNHQEKKLLEAKVAIRTRQIREDKAVIEAQAQRLADLDETKSRFFTNISHEFRTPLTVIMGMAVQLRENPEKWLKKGSLMITRNAENLLNLVNQILALRKLESGHLRVDWVQGDIVPFIRYITESFHSLANTRNVLLRVETKQAKILMDYDLEKFRLILSNLLSNAIKYTPSEGKVTVSVNSAIQSSSHSFLLTVTDTGPGIPADALPNIFDRFYQVDDSVAKASGTGIGLALTQELVKLLGGTIEVESQPGKGTRFTVQIPIRRESNIPLDSKEFITAEVQAPTLHTSPFLTTDSLPQPPQLLLIEDNPDVIEYLISLLENYYQLEFAYNGQAGIKKAWETVPDIIISDVMMPEKDGFEVCDTLKNDERSSHIPIVLLTAKADVESRIKGLRRGADAYLPKPFNQEELIAVLNNLLLVRQNLQAKFSRLEGGAPPASVSNPEDVFLLKLRTYIEEHIESVKISPKQVCSHMGMSRTNLHRKLTALTGLSLTFFVRRIRLGKAKVLLKNSQQDISEIAFAVGFSDPKYFSRVFTEEFQQSPSEFRNQ